MKTIVMLVEGGGIKGREVIKSLVCDDRFTSEYKICAVADTDGKTTRTMDALGVPWASVRNPRQPGRAITELTNNTNPDYIVACGWGYKIPKRVIDSAEVAALNCHSSYLPDYKGVSVYRPQWAHAEECGGATIHTLTDEFDEGAIITQDRYPIRLLDTPLDIAQKYSAITAPLLREALELINAGYDGRQHTGGRYYSTVPWTTTIKHGIVNHVLRALGVDQRWEIEPKRGSKSAMS